MKDTLEEWQLALLVEARKLDDPTVVESNEAELIRRHTELVESLGEYDAPVLMEREDAQEFEQTESLREEADDLIDPKAVETDEVDDLTEAAESIEDFLGEALTENYGLKDEVVEAMSAPQMIDQFRDDETDELSIEALSQHPSTDGEGGDDTDDDEPGSGAGSVEDLEDDDVEVVVAKLEKADRMADRTPEFAESLRAEAADLVGVDDADEIDVEVL